MANLALLLISIVASLLHPPEVFASRPRAAYRPDPPALERVQLVWRPTVVAWPLRPLGSPEGEFTNAATALASRAQLQMGSASTRTGVVEIDGERAVGVWLSALETVRVRQVGDSVPLRFVRSVDGHAAVLEPGREVAPGPGGEPRWELEQLDVNGAIWSIEADAPTRVIVERVEARPARYVAVEAEQDLLEWIADDAADEDLPPLLSLDGEAGARALLQAALARELLEFEPAEGDRHFTRAVEAWRMLAAMAELDRSRDPVRPYYVDDGVDDRVELAGTEPVKLRVVESRPYARADAGQRWSISRSGPGQLRISLRSWSPAPDVEPVPVELLVRAGGRVIARVVASDRVAKIAEDPEAVFPIFVPLLTSDLHPVGELSTATIVIPPGKHDYELELQGGPAILAVEGATRLDATLLSARGHTPRKRARALARALARTQIEAATWLTLLASEQRHDAPPLRPEDPRFDALAERSPLLASVALAIAVADTKLDRSSFAAQFERVRPWLVALARDPGLDPRARGQVTTQWLWLLGLHDRADLADVLLTRVRGGGEPLDELGVDGLRMAAELLAAHPSEETERARVLDVLDRARRLAPTDPGLRAQTLRLWTESTRWSLRMPWARGQTGGAWLGATGEWLVPNVEVEGEQDPRDGLWLELGLGRPVEIRATLGSAPPVASEQTQRVRLLDVHVSSPVGAVDPVTLRLDGRRWVSPQLFGVQRHQLAVAAGTHELEVDGPPGTRAWSALAAADPNQDDRYARRERMWALTEASWKLPGPQRPGSVSLRLRWPEQQPPRPVEIAVYEATRDQPDGVVQRTIVFDPRVVDARQAQAKIEIDHDAVPLGGGGAVSLRHDITLPLAAATTRMWFEVEDDIPVYGSLALRRGVRADDLELEAEGPEAPADRVEEVVELVFEDLGALDDEAVYAELARLSARLLAEPSALDERVRRAALLLLIGETGLARADLFVLSAWTESERASAAQRARAEQLLTELQARFDALIEPREAIVPAGAEPFEPMLIEPALAAVIEPDADPLTSWLELWADARERSVDEALALIDAEIERHRAQGDSRQVMLGELSRAHWLSTDPLLARDAGRLWLEIYGRLDGPLGRAREPLAVALASIRPLLTHLDDPTSDARDAGLAYGLARELLPNYSHLALRRLAFVAALRSDWNTVNHSEQSAGFERLELPVADLGISPSARAYGALLVAPWAGEGPMSGEQQLRAGRKATLAWDAEPGTLSVELWCRATRVDLAPGRAAQLDEPGRLGAAPLTIELTDAKAKPQRHSVELGDAQLHTLELPIAARGRHQLEIILANDPLWTCSWRAWARPEGRDATELIESRRRALWWTINAKLGAEFTILGPASVQLDARATGDARPSEQATQLIATVQVEGQAETPRRGELALDQERERAVITERRRSFSVTHAVPHTLLLPEAKPYRVRIASDRGRALVRVRVRRDRGDLPPPAQVSLLEFELREQQAGAESTTRAPRPRPRAKARDLPPPPNNRAGTLDALIRAGLDEIGDNDSYNLRFGTSVAVGWRREMLVNRLWMRAAAQTMIRERSPVAGGVVLGVTGRIAKLGVRAGVVLDLLAHSLNARSEASVRALGFVDRPIWLGRYTQLRPRVDVGYRWQSLSVARVAGLTGLIEPHPRVYQRYIAEHPLLLRPELALRVYPLQDFALWSRANVMFNSRDAQPIDHSNFDLGFTGIGRLPRTWVPMWSASYQASLRFADAHRDAFQLRHRVDAGLGVGAWARDAARVVLGVNGQANMVVGEPVRVVVELWLRIDAALGRRMRDFGPSELWFGEPWAPRAWGDDERQASTTQGWIAP